MRLTERAQIAVSAHLSPGAIAVDATAGNGHDSAFLARQCGERGHVFAFDVQDNALAATQRSLSENSLDDRVTLVHDCHSRMLEHIPVSAHGEVAALMFNLGFLPGSDKRLTSSAPTTLAAIDASLLLVSPHGIISIMAYRGHEGGQEEAQAVSARVARLSEDDYQTEHVAANGDGPVLWLIKPRQRGL